MAYLQFWDVLVFDVTYKTNKFKMTFALFTGVNHHLQSSLFAGALLEDETTKLLFGCFPNFGDACSKDPCPVSLLTRMPQSVRLSALCSRRAAIDIVCGMCGNMG